MQKNVSCTSRVEPYGIAIHGGAGCIRRENLNDQRAAEYRRVLKAALQMGYAILEKGGSSLDAVENAVVFLEESPLFNAGHGAVFTHEKTIELDASIMDGSGLAGAVAGVRYVRNPIKAARKVFEKSPHVMLIGAGADAFARHIGLEQVDPSFFHTEYRWKQLQKVIHSDDVVLDHSSTVSKPNSDKFGTVGAVALDLNGNLAAATSTGGMTNKRWGRIGDSPIIGAGTYAKNATCAVSCTGHGEFFLREAIAHSVSARMEYGKMTLHAAAQTTIYEQLKNAGGEGGIIAIDRFGNIELPYTTDGMFRGFQKSDGSIFVGIWED